MSLFLHSFLSGVLIDRTSELKHIGEGGGGGGEVLNKGSSSFRWLGWTAENVAVWIAYRVIVGSNVPAYRPACFWMSACSSVWKKSGKVQVCVKRGWERFDGMESHWLLKESVRQLAVVGGPTERGAWIGHGGRTWTVLCYTRERIWPEIKISVHEDDRERSNEQRLVASFYHAAELDQRIIVKNWRKTNGLVKPGDGAQLDNVANVWVNTCSGDDLRCRARRCLISS